MQGHEQCKDQVNEQRKGQGIGQGNREIKDQRKEAENMSRGSKQTKSRRIRREMSRHSLYQDFKKMVISSHIFSGYSSRIFETHNFYGLSKEAQTFKGYYSQLLQQQQKIF